MLLQCMYSSVVFFSSACTCNNGCYCYFSWHSKVTRCKNFVVFKVNSNSVFRVSEQYHERATRILNKTTTSVLIKEIEKGKQNIHKM